MRIAGPSCQNLSMAFYPKAIYDRFRSPAHAGANGSGASGTSASFVCGSSVEISVRIDDDHGSIGSAKFRTNGCGFMVAAADVLCEWLRGKELSELHGLNDDELFGAMQIDLGVFPVDRSQCAAVVFGALRSAMARHRERRIEEFQGEKALICTCFGISEESIERAIKDNDFTEVGQVADAMRAGSGCGSCRFLIQELIDMRTSDLD